MRFEPLSDTSKPPREKQVQAYDAIDKGKNLLVVLPTSYGKTNIAIYLAQKARDRNKFFLMAVPLKALVEEHYMTFNPYFPRVVKVSGDYRENKEFLFDSNVDGFIMTYEMMYQIFLNDDYRKRVFDDVDAIIIDEVHLMGITHRGPIIESFLYLIQKIYPKIQLLLLSATIGNPKQVADHFHLALIVAKDSERPVPLDKEIYKIDLINKKDYRVDLIIAEINKRLGEYPEVYRPNVLVFCPSRDETKSLAMKFQYNRFGIKTDYHHAGRKKEDKNLIETDFREGKIGVLFSTPTLAMGINLPCDIVIISSVRRWDPFTSKSDLLPANEILQMMGRAGRPIQNSKLDYGQAILLCDSKDAPKIERIINKPIRIKSQIPNRLHYCLITWIKAGIVSYEDLSDSYNNLLNSRNTDWTTGGDLESTLNWLCSNSFLSCDNSGYYLLPNALYICKYAVEPKTVLYLNELIQFLSDAPHYCLNLPILFGLCLCVDEFCDKIKVNEDLDRTLLTNAQLFMEYDWLPLHFHSKNWKNNREIVKKVFGLIYSNFIQKWYIDNQIFANLLRKSYYDGENSLLIEDTFRILLCAKDMAPRNSYLEAQLNLLIKGLESNPPIFDEGIIRLLHLPGLTTWHSLLFSKVGIRSINDLLKAKYSDIEQTLIQEISKLGESNSFLYSYNIDLQLFTQFQSRLFTVLDSFHGTIPPNCYQDWKKSLETKMAEISVDKSLKRSSSDGYCINCGIAIDFNVYRPLCQRCYIRSKYKTISSGEYCHRCGLPKANLSLSKPLDFECWKKENS